MISQVRAVEACEVISSLHTHVDVWRVSARPVPIGSPVKTLSAEIELLVLHEALRVEYGNSETEGKPRKKKEMN
jgi:hypothetical protein